MAPSSRPAPTMDKFPAEIYAKIVKQLHDDFCLCDDVISRPGPWHTVRRDKMVWDTRTPKQLQRELCKLRRVCKKFLGPVDQLLFSHGAFIFDVSYYFNSPVTRQITYCNNRANWYLLAHVTGIRVDMRLGDSNRYSEALDRPHAKLPSLRLDHYSITEADRARNELLVALPTLNFPGDSVTSFEVRMDTTCLTDSDQMPPMVNIAMFIRRKLANLKDLFLHCNEDTALAILNYLRPATEEQLTRLLISACPPGRAADPRRRTNPPPPDVYDLCHKLSSYKHLSELHFGGVAGCVVKGPLRLHRQSIGLTRLYLTNLSTTARSVLNLIAKGWRANTETGKTVSKSPLKELAIQGVELDGSVPGDPEGNATHTWSDIFNHTMRTAPDLHTLYIGPHSYVNSPWDDDDEVRDRAFVDELQLYELVDWVREKPGGFARVADVVNGVGFYGVESGANGNGGGMNGYNGYSGYN